MSENEVALARIEGKLDNLQTSLAAMQEMVSAHAVEAQRMAIWQAQIDERLRSGNQKFIELQNQIDARLEKRVVWAYMAGAGLGAAGLVKLLSKIGG